MTTHLVKLPREAARVLVCLQHGAELRAHRKCVVHEHQVTMSCFKEGCPGVENVHRGSLDALIRRGMIDAEPLDKLADVIRYKLTERGKISTGTQKIEDGQANWLVDVGWSEPGRKRRRA
jgi:hypothetical protein